MMNSQLFFDEIEDHLKHDLPFVVYREPNADNLKAFLQESRQLTITKDYSEEGFVFAPFQTHKPSVIFLKETSRFIECDIVNEDLEKAHGVNYKADIKEQNSYEALIDKAIKAIENKIFNKVVLSRKIELGGSVHKPIQLFKKLLNTYKNAFVYCWCHPKVGIWLGATPEQLLRLSRNYLDTVSLAGTLADKSATWTEKEKLEQQLVTDYIVSKLKSISSSIDIEQPKEIKAGRLRHLKTRIRAKLNQSHDQLRSVINQLHPTPAVCGYPKDMALKFISENEGYDRSYYSGFLGEINLTQESSRNFNKRNTEHKVFKSVIRFSSLYVNLRCLEINEGQVSVYVGGGIIESSVPENEWQETVDKSRTMLSIL